MHASKPKQEINSLLPIRRQVFSNLQEGRAPSHIIITEEEKYQVLFVFLHIALAFIAEYCVTG